MIDNYGHILFGYKLDEEELRDKFGDEDFEDFEEEFMSQFGDKVGEKTPGFIGDPMRGEDAYFGMHIYADDMDEDMQEPVDIPDHGEYLEMLNDWINHNNDLFGIILSCATRKEPKMMFITVKS